jgi:hypothetical protein
MCRGQHLAECLGGRDDTGAEAGEALVFECDDIAVAHGAQRAEAPPIGDPFGSGPGRCGGYDDVRVAGYYGFNVNRGTQVAQITKHISGAA